MFNYKFTVERRTPDGALDLDGEQPPSWMLDTDQNTLEEWAAHFDNGSYLNADERIDTKLAQHGWIRRRKTW